MAYSKDLRKRIKAAIEEGKFTQAEILRIFQISRTGFNYFHKHIQETGSIEPKDHAGGRPAVFSDKDIEKIKKFLSNYPDATLEEILDHTGKEASIMAVHRTLKKIGYRLKKNHSSPASKNDKT
jgi:transposase